MLSLSLFNKYSASELRRKLIKSALLVGYTEKNHAVKMKLVNFSLNTIVEGGGGGTRFPK